MDTYGTAAGTTSCYYFTDNTDNQTTAQKDGTGAGALAHTITPPEVAVPPPDHQLHLPVLGQRQASQSLTGRLILTLDQTAANPARKSVNDIHREQDQQQDKTRVLPVHGAYPIR